jgi:ribosomal protein S18 acetylase RimI-like enzyme
MPDIRRLTRADASAYRALRLRALREHPEAFTTAYEEAERQPLAFSEQRLGAADRRFWGAFDGGRLCGAVGLDLETRAKTRHKATLVAMYVAPEHAGRGFGRALVDALVEDARAGGLELVVLTVTEGNSSAMKLYERAGFRSFGVEPRAMKAAGRAYAKNHMYLELT